MNDVHKIGRVIQAQETSWELAILTKQMEIINGLPESHPSKIPAIRSMLATLASVEIGIDEMAGCLQDAMGDPTND